MTRVLLSYFSILLSSILSFAQSGSQLDSIHFLEWNEVDWEISSAYIFNYLGGEDFERFRFDYFLDDRYMDKKEEFFYNLNGYISEYKQSSYNGVGWIPSHKVDYYYDDDGRRILQEMLRYDEISSTYKNFHKFQYTEYTPEGDLQQGLAYHANGNEVYELTATYEYLNFYLEGQLDSVIVQQTSAGSTPFITSSRRYEYDLNGNVIKETWYNSYNQFTDEFQLNFSYEYEYEDGLLIKYFHNEFDVNGVSVPLKSKFYEYDDNRNKTSITHYEWNETVQDYDLAWKQINFWSTLVSNKNLASELAEINWFNQSGGVLNLNIENLDPQTNYQLTIVDVKGQKIHHSQLKNTSNHYENYNLISGSYFVILGDQDGNRKTEKVIITN